MEILHEINPALEALAYLGSRANGHTLDRLEERLQARGVRKAEPFHRASAALRELLQDLDTEVSVPAETLQRLFGDIKGFSYSTIGSYSPAFLFFYPMLSRRQDFETLMQQMERLTPDETARTMMISLSLEEQSGPAAGAAAKLVSRVLALTIPTESRLALLEIHQNYRTLLPEIAACLRPAIAALETESGRIQEIIEAFCREVEGLGTESYLRETSSLAITPEVHYHLIPFLMGPDTNLSMEQEDGSVLICCGVMRLSLRRTLAENSSASQVYDAIRIIGDKTRFDISEGSSGGLRSAAVQPFRPGPQHHSPPYEQAGECGACYLPGGGKPYLLHHGPGAPLLFAEPAAAAADRRRGYGAAGKIKSAGMPPTQGLPRRRHFFCRVNTWPHL